jgi:hypothetical protein
LTGISITKYKLCILLTKRFLQTMFAGSKIIIIFLPQLKLHTMKKQFLFLVGSALILASCGSNNTPPAQSQAQIDSAVNAKVAAQNAANAAKNDSTLRAVEQEKAAVMSKERHEEKRHEEKTSGNNTPAPPPPPPPPPPAGGLKGHSDQSQTSGNTGNAPSGGGLKAHADQNH